LLVKKKTSGWGPINHYATHRGKKKKKPKSEEEKRDASLPALSERGRRGPSRKKKKARLYKEIVQPD